MSTSVSSWVWALPLTVRAGWFLIAAMIFEFVLFRMLVDDFDSLGIAGAPELFGALMVAAHQAASFWIMKNVVRQLFLTDEGLGGGDEVVHCGASVRVSSFSR